MRFLYVAHRYHTNQAPIMKGLVEHGHEVCFVSHYRGEIEDYDYVTPVIAGYSVLFNMINWIYVHIFQRKNSKACDMRLKYGFPSLRCDDYQGALGLLYFYVLCMQKTWDTHDFV